MKPNFALSLSYEGIRLYHRSPAGWDVVGEVALDAPDLSAALSDLRRKGAARDPAPMRTKIVIPNDQIRYLALDTTRATEDDVLAALDGATPYPIAALAHDSRKGGGRTHIAAVARETLDEAEAFAAEYQFAPVGFVAVPEPFTFPGEPFFGRTALADALLAGDEVERDPVPVGTAPAGLSVTGIAVTRAPAVAAVEEPEPVAAGDAGEPAAVESVDAAEPAPWERAAETAAGEEPAAEVDGPSPAAEGLAPEQLAEDAEPPAAAPEAFGIQAQDEPASEGVSLPAAAETVAPEESAELAADPELPTTDDEPAQEVAAPVESAPEADLVVTADPAEPVEPDPVPENAPAAPAVLPEPEPVLAAAPVVAPEPAPEAAPLPADPVATVESPAAEAEPVDTAVPVPEPAAPAEEPEAPVLFASRSRSLRAPVDLPPPVRAVGAGAPAGAEPVFARRAEDRPAETEPPRREPTLARPRKAEPAVAESVEAPAGTLSLAPIPARAPAAPPVVPPLRRVAPGMAPVIDPVPRGAPIDDIDADIPPLPRARTAAQPPRAAPAPRPRRLRLGLILTLALFALLALVAWWSTTLEGGLAGLFGGTTEPAVASADPAPADTEVTAEDAAVAALAAQEPAVAAPEPVTDDLAAGAATGTLVTPDEADRIYAATGVWLRAPRLPLMPETEDLAGLSATDGADADPTETVLAALPTGAGLAPDAGLPVQPVPADPGTVYDRDERGLIRATPEGVLLPTGAMLFAGEPPRVPPTRPGTPAPAPEAVAAAAAEAGMRPLSRPESITAAAVAAGVIAAIEPAAEAAATEPETAAATAVNANLGGVSLNGLRPATRPEGVAPVVLPPWDGPALRLRPEGLAPEGASSVPEEAPAADPAEDLEGALSAIMAAAPDPVAGATAQAVPMALRPDARPNNFSRVVQNQQQILARSQQQAAPAAPAAAAEPQTGGVGTAGLSREEQAETAAEVSSGAIEPSGAVPGGVAQAATQADTINLRDINLLGVFGASNDRHALVRLANGRLVRVAVGDSLDGGQVVAIGDDVLNYSKRGQTLSLQVPGD